VTNKTGIWIDHRKAVIVSILPEGEQIDTVLSNVEKHAQRGGDLPLKGSYEAKQVPADDKRQRALTGHLNLYYDAIIAKTAAADALFVFGPGEAKDELNRRLEHKHLSSRVVAVETSEAMTDRQISAKVRMYFQSAAPA
jgi:hypothetical protein